MRYSHRGSHKLESPWGSFRLRPSVPLSAKVILSLGFFTITACSNGKCQNDRSDHEVVSTSFFWFPLCFRVSTDGFQIFNRGGALWKDLLLPSDWRVWLISFLSSFPPHSYCEWADLATSWEDLPHCSYGDLINSSPPYFWMKHGFIATILKQKHNLCNKRREKTLDTRKRIKVGAIWRQCSLFSLIRKVLYIYTNMFHKVAQTRSIIWKSL